MKHKEKVRLLRLYSEIFRRNSRARFAYERQCDEVSRASLLAGVFSGRHIRQALPPEPDYEPYPDISGFQCGATTRKGTPCRLTTIFSNGRCKLHGGLSTGAKTKAGRKRQREGYRAWLEKQRASRAGRKRTRTYSSDVVNIGAATLSEISTSAAERDLQGVNGIGLHFAGDSITARLTDAQSVTVPLTTSRPHYGGVRWWYVCPSCHQRKATLYLSGQALCCRQCAGIHYASQSR